MDLNKMDKIFPIYKITPLSTPRIGWSMVNLERGRECFVCSIYIISDLSCMLRLPGRWAGTSTVFYPAGGSTAYSPVISCNSAYFTLSVEVLLILLRYPATAHAH